MRLSRRLLPAAALATLLAGACASGPTPNPETEGTAFTRALADSYTTLADWAASESDDTDASDADFFRRRADQAAAGEPIAPRALYDLELPPDTVLDLADARIRLMGALRNNARQRNPEVTARAQAHFDCWTIKTARERSAAAISRCRERFRKALAALEAGGGQARAKPRHADPETG